LKKLIHGWLVLVLIFSALFWSFGLPANGSGNINVLLVNSYHRGYQWTDSINAGIQETLKSHPEITLYIDDLDAKKFGKTKFEVERKYIQEKYAGIRFSGIIVTDNDALDFIIRYKEMLFPQIPVAYAGISNPKDYHFEGTEYYGFEESANSDSVIYLIRKVLPDSKKIMVLADNTTTGKVYRKGFAENAKNYPGLTIDFPDSTNISSIYNIDFTEQKYDAVFYTGISQDIDGSFIEPEIVAKRLDKNINVPMFSNDPKYLGRGMLGGTFQSGLLHGEKVMELIIKLINSTDRSLFSHINYTKQEFFFDDNELAIFNIPVTRLPKGSILFNQKESFLKENFILLMILIGVLSLSVIILGILNRHRQLAHKRSKKNLEEVENRKNELQDAYEKLSLLIIELETTNNKLNKSNLELTEAKKKAEESDKLKSSFLANVSHEIRTPLNSIVGFSSLLAEGEQNPETRKMYMELVESNTESLLVLIDEIIDLSKIEAQQLSLNKLDFSIDVLIAELFETFKRDQTAGRVYLVVKTISDSKQLMVFSDRVRVRQVFINLLSNAFKFTESGTIEFGYELGKKDEIILYVKDTGIGISKEYHKAIFHRFRKLNENAGKVFRGTGLGLAITQKLVELLGGKIWIESEPGKGSVFKFTLDGLRLSNKE